MPKNKKLPPIDLFSPEWIFFDWVNRRVVRGLERGVARALEQPMPKEYRHATLIREDNGELILHPDEYCHFTVAPKVIYRDPLFGDRVFAWTRCRIEPELLCGLQNRDRHYKADSHPSPEKVR